MEPSPKTSQATVVCSVASIPHHKKKRGKIIGYALLQNAQFRLGQSGFMVPVKPGACVRAVEVEHDLPHSANTSDFANACVSKKIDNVFFGLNWVRRFGKHKLYRVHVQTTAGLHFTQLTHSTLPCLHALLASWGEAQGKNGAPGTAVTKRSTKPQYMQV